MCEILFVSRSNSPQINFGLEVVTLNIPLIVLKLKETKTKHPQISTEPENIKYVKYENNIKTAHLESIRCVLEFRYMNDGHFCTVFSILSRGSDPAEK